ncbi:hypothetical protein BV25DRAFT_1901971 [Artomyces pyxidatus]|uniref:Uncharacterized protein n=1 Tax=Artomyces pyxidatus TaxID=48021 RepID=A0ACB8SRN3_9AGAM|nr:hypothetical protein BV25DRAFT_1901971 [Artomyces pyxidatus]
MAFRVPQSPASNSRPTALPPAVPGYTGSNGASLPPLLTPSAFRAPAHKHAHHLHSIPPREKSTRTLIIDHLLWAHARTRFAQARAELAMTDRAPSSANRERPETWDEDQEASSDGEHESALRARAGGPGHPHDDEEEERSERQNLALARKLRLRAEGLEKVVSSMLDQPPQDHPFPEDEPILPVPSPPRPVHNPHTLPNGVRLRLALATVINDLFARQAPVPRHLHVKASRSNSSTASSDTPTASSSSSSSSSLPSTLIPLTTVSVFSEPHTSTRTRDMFIAGADPTTANSPPSLRCARHLHTGCEICVEAKGKEKGARRVQGAAGAPGGGLSGFKDGSGVGSGLSRPGPGGNVLRRQVSQMDEDGVDASERPKAVGKGNTRLGELIPRFVRLSALVAMELAREVSVGVGVDELSEDEGSSSRSPNRNNFSNGVSAPQNPRALKPETTWYMLLAGLLTRAVLEGYLSAGWTGLTPVQVLLGVGLGGGDSMGEPVLPPEEFSRFEPDDMPELGDAIRVLFPALRTGMKREDGEAEFETEMATRLALFLDVPAGTPDLSTHMEDLAWQYPAEPVERAALRFCEAVARWRGKPELETYKKRPPGSEHGPAPSATNTGAVRLAIEKYFVMTTVQGRKRARSGAEPGPEKRTFAAPRSTLAIILGGLCMSRALEFKLPSRRARHDEAQPTRLAHSITWG